MSYDIFLRCPACGQSPDRLSPTYNLGQIFRLALQPLDNGIYSLEGLTGHISLPWLRGALERLVAPSRQEEFRALEPANGWGTLNDARKTIETMIDYATRFPISLWDLGGERKGADGDA
jgi:hypothetical protein